MGSFCYTVQNTLERKAEGGAHGAEVDRSGGAGLIPDAAALGENRQADSPGSVGRAAALGSPMLAGKGIGTGE